MKEKNEVQKLSNEIYWLREELGNYQKSRPVQFTLKLISFYSSFKRSSVAPIYFLKHQVGKRLTDGQKKKIRKAFDLDFFKRKIVIENQKWEGPLVTIVTPFYNHGATFNETLESVLAQTFQNFEYIIVDDGSKPEDISILEKIKNEKVQVIFHGKNLGKGSPAAARNTGIKAARGKYIVCLDADDKLDLTYLEKLALILEADPNREIAIPDFERFGAGDKVYSFGSFHPSRLINSNCVNTASMFPKAAWETVGGYKEGIGYEDWEFWINLAEHGYWGRHIPEPLLKYRTALESRYIGDSPKHKSNIKTIKKLHKNYKLKIFSYNLKKFFVRKVVSIETAFLNINLGVSADIKPAVLILAPWMTFGGAETLLYNYSKGITKEFDINFITTLRSKNEWEDKFREVSSKIFHLPNLFFEDEQYIDFIINYIKTRNIRVLHGFHVGYKYNIFQYLDRIKRECPDTKLIFTFFNSLVPLFPVAVEEAEKINLYVSDNQKVLNEIKVKNNKAKTLHISNGLDTENEFNPENFDKNEIRKSLGLSKEDFAFLFIGRLDHEKGIDTLLEIANRLSKNKKVKFLVVGDGPLKNTVVANKNITYLGYRPNSEVPRLLAASNAFILTSKVEGSPQTIIESMSMQLPIVASNAGDLPILVDKEGGYVFKQNDIAGFVRAINQLVENDGLAEKMGKYNRGKAVKKYTRQIMIDNYKNMYQEVIDEQ